MKEDRILKAVAEREDEEENKESFSCMNKLDMNKYGLRSKNVEDSHN